MLNIHSLSKARKSPTTASSVIRMMWVVQQSLLRMEAPKFSGNHMKWVEFVIKFEELVLDQVYLQINSKLKVYIPDAVCRR